MKIVTSIMIKGFLALSLIMLFACGNQLDQSEENSSFDRDLLDQTLFRDNDPQTLQLALPYRGDV